MGWSESSPGALPTESGSITLSHRKVVYSFIFGQNGVRQEPSGFNGMREVTA